jgi:hypothetical protein
MSYSSKTFSKLNISVKIAHECHICYFFFLKLNTNIHEFTKKAFLELKNKQLSTRLT